MSKDSQSLSSSQNVSQEATQQKKITKVGARYIQIEEFKDSDHHRGYFCYNCVYFVKPHHCAIVTDESTPGISAQFSCDFCNKTFNSREALKQHRIKEHNNDQ